MIASHDGNDPRTYSKAITLSLETNRLAKCCANFIELASARIYCRIN